MGGKVSFTMACQNRATISKSFSSSIYGMFPDRTVVLERYSGSHILMEQFFLRFYESGGYYMIRDGYYQSRADSTSDFQVYPFKEPGGITSTDTVTVGQKFRGHFRVWSPVDGSSIERYYVEGDFEAFKLPDSK